MHPVALEIIQDVMTLEGYFSDDKDDLGGATKYGITQGVAAQHGILDVAELTQSQAIQIYYTDYLIKPNYLKFYQELLDMACPKEVARDFLYELFECAVNIGVLRTSSNLQRSLNLLQSKVTLRRDGILGSKSLNAFRAFYSHRRYAGVETLITFNNVLQGIHYIEISEMRKQNRKFLYGWFKKRVAFRSSKGE